MESLEFTPFYPHNDYIYRLDGFTPAVVDAEYLQQLGVQVMPRASSITSPSSLP